MFGHLILNTDFVVGVDSFEDLEINAAPSSDSFFYFTNTKKTLVKRFILKRTEKSQKHCIVTLIKRRDGPFEPRFEFKILDLTKGAIQQVTLPIEEGEDRLVKARIDLGDCHQEFSQLIAFVSEFPNVSLDTKAFAIIGQHQKAELAKLMGEMGKDAALEELAKQYSPEITEADINLLADRRRALDEFQQLLRDPEFFSEARERSGKRLRPEDVWQQFFERNTWIFGYGLQLVACDTLNDKKLETIVVGSDFIDGAGKRVDALLKSRGRISKALFSEIKTHTAALVKGYPRPAVFVPGDDLQGGVSQVQKTIHKVSLKLSENLKRIAEADGTPTGEELFFVRPRGLVVVGMLDQFDTAQGINEEMFASFELYRQSLLGVDVLTYDELYERTRFIVEPM